MVDNKNRIDDVDTGDEGIPTASYRSGTVGPGGQIGQYKLLSILGEGGYGIVYFA